MEVYEDSLAGLCWKQYISDFLEYIWFVLSVHFLCLSSTTTILLTRGGPIQQKRTAKKFLEEFNGAATISRLIIIENCLIYCQTQGRGSESNNSGNFIVHASMTLETEVYQSTLLDILNLVIIDELHFFQVCGPEIDWEFDHEIKTCFTNCLTFYQFFQRMQHKRGLKDLKVLTL